MINALNPLKWIFRILINFECGGNILFEVELSRNIYTASILYADYNVPEPGNKR